MKKIVYKIAGLVFTVFCIATITFILMRVAPGSPYSDERSFGPETESELINTYSVKSSFIKQYFFYIKNVFTLNLGPSLKYRDVRVSEILGASIPVSFTLGFCAFIIALFSGIILGFLSAYFDKNIFGRFLHTVSIFGVSIPVFALAILFVMVFSFRLRLFPVAGWGGPEYIILPALVLAMPYIAFISNLFRSSYLAVWKKEYVIFCEERGISRLKIIFKYMLPEAISPVVSYSGPAMAGLLTGSIVVENIFAIPGMGTHFINSALNRDYTLLFGMVLVYSVTLVLLNFASDFALKALNPRIKN